MSKKNETKTNVMRILDKNNVSYKSFEFDPKDFDSVTALINNNNTNNVFKTLICTNGKKEYFVFMIPSLKKLDLKKAAKVSCNKSMSMLPQKELQPLTGYVHGGCSPIGMKKIFKVYISSLVMQYDEIYYSAGKLAVLVLTSRIGLFKIINPTVADVCVDEESL